MERDCSSTRKARSISRSPTGRADSADRQFETAGVSSTSALTHHEQRVDPRRQPILLPGGDETRAWTECYEWVVPLADDLYDEYLHDLEKEGLGGHAAKPRHAVHDDLCNRRVNNVVLLARSFENEAIIGKGCDNVPAISHRSQPHGLGQSFGVLREHDGDVGRGDRNTLRRSERTRDRPSLQLRRGEIAEELLRPPLARPRPLSGSTRAASSSWRSGAAAVPTRLPALVRGPVVR